MTPYRQGTSGYWKTRVRHPDGRRIVAGCDTTSKVTAKAMTRWVAQLYDERTPDGLAVLDAIVGRRVTLPAAFDGRFDLPGLLARVRDIDLEPHVARWLAVKQASRKGAASAAKYERQVRRLIPADEPFALSQFSRATIDAHLRGLDVQDPTRNRHRAALASFAKYLVREGVIPQNPVREIEGWSEGEGRLVHYSREQAQTLVGALAQPYAAIDALMVGAGLEWQAVARLRARDLDLTAGTVQAHGGKTRWRNRLCRIVEEWTIRSIAPALKGKLPDALVFDGITEWGALAAHKAAAKAKGLPPSTLHDWRHTHAVLMLRAGYKPTVVAHQLGHRDTSLVWSRYGRFVVDSSDYVLPARGLERSKTSHE